MHEHRSDWFHETQAERYLLPTLHGLSLLDL